MGGQFGRAVVTVVVLLLGTVVGAYLWLAAAYLVLDPAERTGGGVLFAAILAALLVGLALVARRASGGQGLAAFVFFVFLGAIAAGLLIL